MMAGELPVRCWCDWSASDDPAETHEDHILANDYPDHEPSPEWNVPEPPPDWTPPAPARSSLWYCPDREA